MIDDAVAYIRREVVQHLGVADTDVIAGNVHTLKDDSSVRGLYVSVANLEQEPTLRNTPHAIRQNGAVHYQEPPVHLNLYLLFTADFGNYLASLLRLSQTIELFQSKRVFEAGNAGAGNPFPPTLEKLVFDYYNLNLEQLNHLWGVLGGAYFPSAVYKVRLVRIQRDVRVAGPEITTVQLDTHLR
jgi:uncharacterized protein DUF4255